MSIPIWHNREKGSEQGGGLSLLTAYIQGARVYDSFSRTESNGWGTSDTGHAWTTTGGSASDYSVNGSGVHTLTSAGTGRLCLLPGVFGDVDITYTVSPSALALTQPITSDVLTRWDFGLAANIFRLEFETDATITATISVSGVGDVDTAVLGFSYTAGQVLNVRVQNTGPLVRMRVWRSGIPQPSSWQLSGESTVNLMTNLVAVRSTRETGNTNTDPTVSYDNFLVKTDRWTDVAGDILHEPGGLDIEMAGRVNEFALNGNARARMAVVNTGTYTPGYSGAPLALEQGMRLHVKETVGRRSFDHFTGTLQQPEALFRGLDTNNGNTVTVDAIDDLEALDQGGRTFISTLAEWILDRSDDLVCYWPMGETAGVRHESAIQGQTAITLEPIVANVEGVLIDGTASYSMGSDQALPADDIPRPMMVPQLHDTGSSIVAIDGQEPVATLNPMVEATTGQYVTLACWVRPTGTVNTSYQVGLAGNHQLYFHQETTGAPVFNVWAATCVDAGITFTAEALGGSFDAGNLSFLSVTVTPGGGMTFRHNRATHTGTVTGTIPNLQFTHERITHFTGSVGHLQVYVGDVDAFTDEDHIAQYEEGLGNLRFAGLRWQRSDERIGTLMRYAGITGHLDRGTAYMPRASLAGKTFSQAALDAIRTEQGRLFVDGSGDAVFHNRIRTRYNL